MRIRISIKQIYSFIICFMAIACVVFKMFGWEEAILVTTVIAFCIIFLNNMGFRILLNNKVIILYWLLLMSSTAVNYLYGNTHGLAGIAYDTGLVMFILIGVFAGRYLDFEKILKVLYVFLACSVFFGLVEYITKNNILLPYFYVDNLSNVANYRICSFFVHPVICALFYLIFFWINVYVEIQIKWKIVMAALTVFGMYATGSRSTWVAFAVTVIVYFFMKKRSIKLKDILFTVGVIVGILVFINSSVGKEMMVNIVFRMGSAVESYSYSQRIGGWTYLIEDFFGNLNPIQILLGHGYKGAYDTLLGTTIEITGFFTTDNTFIAILYNYGLIPVIMIISLIVKVVKRVLRRGDDIQNCIGMLILSSALVCFFFECNLFLQASFYIYFFVGAWIGISYPQLISGNEKTKNVNKRCCSE